MLPEGFNVGGVILKVFKTFPSVRFRDKDKTTHNAGDATKCGRQITYKALKVPESNPTDNYGQFRMRFGNWLESGLMYEFLEKAAPYGLYKLAKQADAGEHGTFYGTSWHGYRDADIAIATPTDKGNKLKPIILELKTKVGYGAALTIKKTAYSKQLKVPVPEYGVDGWGYCEQLSLYMRNAYLKTVNNPQFTQPVRDGILLYLLYTDGVACFAEFHAEYQPETDQVKFYRVVVDEYPELNTETDIVINLKEIADRWSKLDKYLADGTLAPPDFERRYDVNDPKVGDATKTDLEAAVKGHLVIGHTKCKYCSWKDQCAKDLNISLTYSESEKKHLKSLLNNK